MVGVEIVHGGHGDIKSSDEDEDFIRIQVEEDSLQTSLDNENEQDTADVNSKETHNHFYFGGVAYDLPNLEDVDEYYLFEELDIDIDSNTKDVNANKLDRQREEAMSKDFKFTLCMEFCNL